MEAAKQIELFKEFVEKVYEKKLYELVSKGAKSLLIDFKELSEFSPELSEDVLDDPEETIKAGEVALSQIDMPELGVSESGFLNRVRFTNLPDSQGIHIKNIRSNHLNKFVVVDGIVRQTSDVRPQVTSAKFECPSCGNTLTILQVDVKFKEPSRCSCGRKGKFRLLSKDLVDAQRVVIEESPENLEGGEQAKRMAVFLKEDLVEPRMEKKTTPGTKVRIMGIIREIPITAPGGGQLIRYDLMIECNYIEPIEEAFEELDLKKEDVDKIKELAKDPLIYEKLTQSIAPSIYGHDDIKEALVLQLFGGVKKIKEDGTRTRGDLHILTVGDPGCIAGDSQVAMVWKGMDKIQSLGKFHGQPIREFVTKIRKNAKDRYYDCATVFQKYDYQPVLKVITETGKEVVCTYNQPFLTKEGWKRADEIPLNTKIRVMPKIPNKVNKLMDTNFARVEKKSGVLKEVSLPEKFTEDLAGLCGYIIGDGNVHPNGYRITCYVNEEEADLINKISLMWKNTFNIEPSTIQREVNPQIKIIDDGNGLLRQFVSTQDIHLMEINSRQIAQSLSFLSNKRVPQQIFKSPKNVVAKFISWLFDADGCAFGIGRGRCSIQLKSVNVDLLKDVQLLLLYFGIQSRIIEDNLCIRRSFDMELFIKSIGFNSEKKKRALEKVLEVIRNRNDDMKRKGYQRYEKVVKIIPYGFMDVYDFEVPLSHSFIANGIVCHNSGKSQMLQFISKAAPKVRFISGKGATSAGITASVVKDEFLKGFALEAGALVLANKGIAVVDELDKMNPEDRSALHEALEQQCYMPNLELSLADGSKTKIGYLVNSLMEKYKNDIQEGINCQILPLKEDIKILTTNFESIYPVRINKLSRHIAPDKLVRINLNNGKKITVTIEHPCWIVKDGKIITIPAKNICAGEFFPVPGELPISGEEQKFEIAPFKNGPELSKLLGYHITDGCYELNRGIKNGIQFWNNDKDLINDYSNSIKKLFNIDPGITQRNNQYAVRVVSKRVFTLLRNLDENLVEKGIYKKIPEKIMKCRKEDLAFLLRALFDGDGTVVMVKRNGCRVSIISENIELANQITELLLRFGITSSIYKDRAFFKVDISGQENLKKYYENIGFTSKKKQNRLEHYLNKEKTYRSITDIIPNSTEQINSIFKRLKINKKKYLGNQICMGYNKHRIFLQKMIILVEEKLERLLQAKNSVRKTKKSQDLGKIREYLEFSILSISKKIGISSYMLMQNEERDIENDKYQKLLLLEIDSMLSVIPDLRELKKLAFGKIRWSKIKSVEIIQNPGLKWVYDIMIEKTHSFISNNMVLHNSITINKANVQATLRAETTLLAAANPKLGRFDPYQPIAAQIDLPPTLINRFDLIFPVRDLPNKEKDEKIASHVLTLQQKPKSFAAEIPVGLLKIYVSYAKQNVFPILTDQAIDEIKSFYVELRNSNVQGGEGVQPIPISARQLEALVRLSEASAKIRLSDKVTRDDSRRAIRILKSCLMQVGFDYETGKIDIDRISTGITASTRNKILTIKDIITELEGKVGKSIPIEDLINEAIEKGITKESVEEIIENLRRQGEVFEPRRGFISKI